MVESQPQLVNFGIDDAAGALIGQYKLIRQLGDGMYGTGMLAEDTTRNNKKVCVKLFKGLEYSVV